MKKTLMLAAGAAVAVSLGVPVLAGDLRAGAGKVMITPDRADFPMQAAGEKDFVGVHDDMYARAIALDDGASGSAGRYVLVNIEVTIVPDGDGVIKAVASATGLPVSHVLVFSSHTHSNPLVFYHGHDATPAQVRAIAKVRSGAVDAAKAALAALQPAKIGFGRGEAHGNINNGEERGLTRWFDANGRSSKALNLLKLETRDGRPLALLVNYASHGEVMFRSVSKDGGYEASGDLPGATMRLLEASGGAPIVLWSPAAEADQLPLFKSVQPAVGTLPAADEGAQGWALVNVQARRLAIEITQALASIEPMRGDATIKADMGSVACPGQALRVDHDNGGANGGKATAGAPVTIPLNFLRINDIALAGIAGDVGSKIGASIEGALSQQKSMVMTLMAGSIGYILPHEAYLKPGHAVGSSSLQDGCAEAALVGKFKAWDARP